MNNELITYYWSRVPGKFVNKHTGEEVKLSTSAAQSGPVFNFTAFEWYQTLLETITDIDEKKSVNKLVVSRDGLCFIECLILYRSNVDDEYTGILNKKYHVSVNDKSGTKNIIDLYFDDYLVGHVVILDTNIL